MFLKKIVWFTGKYILIPLLSKILLNNKSRIAWINVDRIGHLAMNTHLFFIKKKMGSLKDLNYYLIAPSTKSKKIANVSLLKMFISYSKKVEGVQIICSNFLYFFVFFFFEEFKNSGLLYELSMEIVPDSEFSLGINTIEFDESQKKYGESILKKTQIPTNKKIVTIFARDSSYLSNKEPDKDWSYHSYRDADIETYVDAVKFLIDKNYAVVRIGSEYSKKLNFSNENYFEYSLSEFKSGFLDLYLIYKSTFILGNSSGAVDLADVFNVPWAAVNYAPFMCGSLGKESIYIQKKLIDSNGVIVPFKDIIGDSKYYLHDGVKLKNDFGLEYIDNSPEEILDIAKEMHNILNGTFIISAKQKSLLKRYQDEYCKRNNWSNKSTPISINWLEKNHHLYLEDSIG
jgi:putative glycosyltransferase (TIGR04372 family)